MRTTRLAGGWLSLSLATIGTLLVHSTAFCQVLSADGEVPGTKIEIRDLKRDEGGTVTLRFQLINNSDRSFSACSLRETGDTCEAISGVHLIDVSNKKKYLVVRDSAQKCVCATLRNLGKGEKTNLWIKFPAPPDNVQKITVVVPQFDPIENVPITPR